jgi:hypothetical protein
VVGSSNLSGRAIFPYRDNVLARFSVLGASPFQRLRYGPFCRAAPVFADFFEPAV